MGPAGIDPARHEHVGTGSGHVFRIAGIDAARPHKMAWTATNVMPFQAIEDLPTDQPIVVITTDKGLDALQEAIPGNWESIGSCGDMYFYRRAAE